jgi:sec-independent protein translocase protein TatC
MNWLRKLFSFRENRDRRAADDAYDTADRDVVKPFLEHLEDLRKTLFKMAAALLSGMVVAFYYHDPLYALVMAPIKGLPIKVISTTLVGPFALSLKLAFYGGIVASFPLLLYFAAEFVLPALTRRERRMLLPGIGIGFLLFGCGVVLSYHYILPKTIQWFFLYGRDMGIETMLEATTYFGFVAQLSLACGLLCELPIIVIALAVLGVINYRLLASTRPYAVTLILILVAILSPTPDPITFLTLAMPVLLIYEICIWIVWLMERRRRVT